MNDIIRKQMKDVIVPSNDVVRRVANVPEPYISSAKESSGERIEKNPFFEKQRVKNPPNKISRGGRGSADPKERDPRKLLWALLFALLLASGFVAANYFSTATIEIAPITRSATFDTDLIALKEQSENELTFQFMSLVEEKLKEVPATVEKKIQKKASGKVVIFNAYNGDSQRLIKNTRLESPDHKIFRIDQSVVVPGAKVVNGKMTPGSVEVVAYADVAGKEYNIGTTNFTIPGFKDDPRYAKFTAASKPDSPMDGGFSGSVKVPSDEAVLSAREELKQELKKETTEKVRAQIPPNVSFFPGSIVIKFEEVPQDFTAGNATKISVRATISVFFFDTALLTKKLVEIALPADKGNSFAGPDISKNLTFLFLDPIESVILSDLSKLRFHITGTTVFVGQINDSQISTALAGKNKKEFGSVIGNQSNIYKANLIIRPMWKTMFPSNPAKIVVKIIGE